MLWRFERLECGSRKQLVIKTLVLAALIIYAVPARAEEVWTLVPGRTSIGFSVKHFVLMNVKGRFKDCRGEVRAPNGDFSKASVDVQIPVTSVFTGNSDRDAHLKTTDFFDSQSFPEMRFQSTKVVRTHNNRFKMEGLLTIRNTSKPVVLDVERTGTKSLSNGSVRSDFVATGIVNRYDYGLRWNELTEAGSMVVDETVKITLEVSLLKKQTEGEDGPSGTLAQAALNSIDADDYSHPVKRVALEGKE